MSSELDTTYLEKRIIVDTAEPEEIGYLFEDKGYDVIRSRINPTGDYAFGRDLQVVVDDKGHNHVQVWDGVVVERKEINDFDSSFANDNPHLWDQFQRMQMMTDDNIRTFYLIMGDPDLYNQYANVSMKERIGAVASAQGRYPNVPITFLMSDQSFVAYIDKLFRNYRDGKFAVARKMKFKTTTYGSFDEYVFQGVPGVGEETAKNILERFQIQYSILDQGIHWEPQGLPDNFHKKIKGVGPKTVERIRESMKL